MLYSSFIEFSFNEFMIHIYIYIMYINIILHDVVAKYDVNCKSYNFLYSKLELV